MYDASAARKDPTFNALEYAKEKVYDNMKKFVNNGQLRFDKINKITNDASDQKNVIEEGVGFTIKEIGHGTCKYFKIL